MMLLEPVLSRDDDEPMSTPTPKPPEDDVTELLAEVRALRAKVQETLQRVGKAPQTNAIRKELTELVLETSYNAEDRKNTVCRMLNGCTSDIERLQLAQEITLNAFFCAFGELVEFNGRRGRDKPKGAMRRAHEVAQFAIVCGLTMLRRCKLPALRQEQLRRAYAATTIVQTKQEKAPQPFLIDLVLHVEASLKSADGHSAYLMKSFAEKHEAPAFCVTPVLEVLLSETLNRKHAIENGQPPKPTSTVVKAVYDEAAHVNSGKGSGRAMSAPLRGKSLVVAIHDATAYWIERGYELTVRHRKAKK